MENWTYTTEERRRKKPRNLFLWLLDKVLAVVTILMAMLLALMYLAPYIPPKASWIFSLLGLADVPVRAAAAHATVVEYVPQDVVHALEPQVVLPVPDAVNDALNTALAVRLMFRSMGIHS